MRKLLFCAALLLSFGGAWGQACESYKFAERDTCSLWLDVYQPQGVSKNTTIVYVFGGGFVAGSRTEAGNVRFYGDLVARGYRVVAIDYRLGLKGVTNVGALNPKPPFKAVRIAAEDLLSATKYLIDSSSVLGVDTSRIVLVGSSAGAITVLQADYELANRSELVAEIPLSFRYAGVVSLSGAIFSTQGKPKYSTSPAPTMLFHGTDDKVVVYRSIQVLHLGMFGTDRLASIFAKNDYPYIAVRYQGAKHEVAEFPRTYNQGMICDFIDRAADKKFSNQIDVTINDRDAKAKYKMNLTRKDLYNGN